MNNQNGYQHDNNAEISYLDELIDSFRIKSGLQAEDAIKIIYARYSELEKKRSNILSTTTMARASFVRRNS